MEHPAPSPAKPPERPRPRRRFGPAPLWRKFRERCIESSLFLSALLSVLVTAAIVFVLLYESVGFFRSAAEYKHVWYTDVKTDDYSRQGEQVAVVLGGEKIMLAEPDAEKRERLFEEKPPTVRVVGDSLVFLTADRREVATVELTRQQRENQRPGLVEGKGSVGGAVWEFLTETEWTPMFSDSKFGILPLLMGTLVTTLVALAVALPLGSIVAIYLSEYAPALLREVLKPALELLSAVPTIIYGYFALQFVTPLLQRVVPDLPTFNMLSAGIVMGIMIIPYVSSLSEDAMRAVPSLLREGSYALGANKLTTALRVVYPAALSGIGSAYILGISRAVGETMIVAVAAGQKPNLTADPRESAATITAFIVQVSQGDLPHGSVAYQSIFAAGLALFALTFVFNVAGYWLRKRFREAY